ncbi:MAG: NADH-quinone oxidoreductase subunit NuoG [Desulfomonilaceae bacterium]
MPTIYIDNKPYQVEAGQDLLTACLSLGFNIPYFCWHPALHSVGACRQCAVKVFKDENDTRGRIMMSCMTPASDGMRLSIDDPEVKEFRAGIIELLMANHPHDCPVCDEGGECHLQDMTVMTGHTYRRFRFNKRTYRNQNLGPFLNHEMNRCIQCYRCERFYRDYAGGRDFNVFGINNRVYFGRFEDGTLENEFSGNLVEICPTGVFTDKTLKKHFTRKWDLQTGPSVCVHCGLGCNTIPGERYGVLRRIRNRYNGEVNGYFLCDRGRYGYEFVNSEKRIRRPLMKSEETGLLEPTDRVQALRHLSAVLKDSTGVIGIGSPRAPLEANFVLRTLVGPERFFAGTSEAEYQLTLLMLEILRNGPAKSPSLHEVETSDAVLVLGEDVTNFAPMLALALRQSSRQKPMERPKELKCPMWSDYAVRHVVQDKTGPIFVATPAATKLDDVALHTLRSGPTDLARIGFAVAHELASDAPAGVDLPEEFRSFAQAAAEALREAERPLVVSGASCGSASLVKAAANVAWALCNKRKPAGLCFTVPECNSLGLGLMNGRSLAEAFAEVLDGRADTVILLENDLYRRAETEAVKEFFSRTKHLIVIEHLQHACIAQAEVVLPAGTFAEADGTLVNNEGRAQRFFQVMTPDGEVQQSRQWLMDMMADIGRPEAEQWQTLDDITAAMARSMPEFGGVLDIAPAISFRVAGMKIPRQPHRYSGRTSMHANVSVHEPKSPEDPDSALAFSMEGYEGQPPSAIIPRFWSPGWNSVQALNKFQSEVGGPLRGGDPGVRLIEPTQAGQKSYFQKIPVGFQRRKDEWLIVPTYHIFGSEELSAISRSVAERVPEPYLWLNDDDAVDLDIAGGSVAQIDMVKWARRLIVKLDPSLPKGIAGLAVGLPGSDWINLPAWGRVRAAR